MKRTLTSLVAIALLSIAGPAMGQDESADPISDGEDPLNESTESETEATVEAEAGDENAARGPLGLGITGILAGATGGEVVYRVSPDLQVVGFLGLNFFSPDAGDSATALAIAAAGLYRLAGAGRASLHAGLRLDLGIRSAGETATQFAMEAPLRVELKLSDEVVLHAETGLVVAFIPDEGPVLGSGAAGATKIQLGGQLLGSFGLTLFL